MVVASIIIRKESFETVVCTTYWLIWRFRNDVVHETRKLKKDALFDTIRELTFLWFSNRCNKVIVSWSLWLQNPLNF